ncbi:hypothetical protein RRG08_058999 [Elysia crispata]|uniref:Caspase family p10 domain-containing protein n=1 Tax=Elysia crispata TaxID=231223 RepID=A0AAE0ZEX9_9GAST|nr:hypothetical protein RRG08_058999 [Elysia crispata]
MSSNNRHLSIPGYLDKGVRLDEPDGGTLPATSSSSTSSPKIAGPGSGALPQQLPSMSDMLVCYPTLTGYYAWRNRARGSWYIEAIVQVFMRYAKCEDVCAMLNRCEDVCAMLNRVRCGMCLSSSKSVSAYVKCEDVCAMLNRAQQPASSRARDSHQSRLVSLGDATVVTAWCHLPGKLGRSCVCMCAVVGSRHDTELG